MDETPSATKPKHRRRWYQFGLRTLLIGVALLAVPCAYVAREASIVRERRLLRERLDGSSNFDCLGSIDPSEWRDNRLPPKVSWLRRLMGDQGVSVIILRPDHMREMHAIQSAFPEAEIIVPAHYPEIEENNAPRKRS